MRVVPRVSGIRLGHGGSRIVPGAQPVEDRPHRWPDTAVEGAESAAQPDDLEQHRVEHDLLEDDGLRPPLADVGQAVDPAGRQRE